MEDVGSRSMQARSPDREVPPTRSQWVDEKLRAAILSGELSPGEKLVVANLVERWQVSPTPLREAFQRLAGTGLVELVPQRGARVADVSIQDMLEVYEIRELLEPLAFKRSLIYATPEWRQRVEETYGSLIDVLDNQPEQVLELEERHRTFHRALLSGCDSGWLLRLVDMLAEHSIRYRLLSIAPRGGPGEVKHEHVRLFEAAVGGHQEEAVSLLTEHLRLTVESLSGSPSDGQET
jgi:GntR family transcriptional regulator, carbon starvation induced regulator